MSPAPFPRRVCVLGATGTIGEKALRVIVDHPDRFRLVSLAAGGNAGKLAELARAHRPARVALADPARLAELRAAVDGIEVEAGEDSVAALAEDPEVDLVVHGIVGAAGLEASLRAARAGKQIALANKESLVLAGELFMREARAHNATVLPVDSEHSGLFQCLLGVDTDTVSRLIITASGGPFRGRSREELASVTPESALQHPIWPMGRRITVDSATLMNKGLEVIETHHLFGVPYDRIGVWVHPQSVIHAVVEMRDGSQIAQLAEPDMLLPVQYAMSYPERWPAQAPSDPVTRGALTFEEPDRAVFRCLDLAFAAGRRGGTAPAVLNAADEVAVAAFLERGLPFLQIPDVVEAALDAADVGVADSLQAILEADGAGRRAAEAEVARRVG